MLRYNNKASEVTHQKTSMFKKDTNNWYAAAHITEILTWYVND